MAAEAVSNAPEALEMHEVPTEAASAGRTPRATEVLALLVIVPAVAAATRVLAVSNATVSPRQSAMVVGAFAALFGVPALAFLSERGRLGLGALTSMGALAGAVPPLLLALSGVLGFLLIGGPDYTTWALGRGISLPMYGPIRWPHFIRLAAWSTSVGLASGLIYGLLVPRAGWRSPVGWLLALATLGLMIGVGGLLT